MKELPEYKQENNSVRLICKHCGLEYLVTPARADKSNYCSYSCNAKQNKPKRKNYPAGEEHPRWKGGRLINSQGYVLVYCPEYQSLGNSNYVREHRLVMEKEIGRCLRPEEDIHHINGIKTDNRIENLRLYDSRSAHIKNEHHKP